MSVRQANGEKKVLGIEWVLIRTLGTIMLICTLVYPYVLSAFAQSYVHEFDPFVICTSDRSPKIRVLTLNRVQQRAEIYCLYPDARYNTRVIAERVDTVWKPTHSEVVGKGLYWPFYL
jgi:hypothetical protein